MSNVESLDKWRQKHADPATTAKRCEECGGVWFSVSGIVVALDGHVMGYDLPLTCRDCGEEAPID